MRKWLLLATSLCLIYIFSIAQDNSSYLKTNAVRVNDPLHLSDSVFKLLSPFRIIMIGEMHGTKEPAELVAGLAKLFAAKGDSVLVGFEIPDATMSNFISSRTDSSIYQSEFFANLSWQDGRQSFAWAKSISLLKNNPRIHLFFFDVNEGQEKKYDRDSLMYAKIKEQMLHHPNWKTITLSGNAHAMISEGENKAASYLKNDKTLNLSAQFCSISSYYQKGSYRGNFGNGGLEDRTINRPANEYDTTFSFDKYLLLVSAKSTYPYTGFYYTKTITPAEMVKGNLDLKLIRKQLEVIYTRDQKTRVSADSAQFMDYVDSTNMVMIENLIAKYGWMGKSFIGGRGNYTFWLVLQHAPIEAQEKYLPLLQESVDAGESRPVDLAYLQDRVLMREGKKQIYGTQVTLNKTGGQEFYPIEDEKNVNARRAKLDLPPMEEYAKRFGMEYKLPDK